ncbi:NifB/NifX family molybdenum-iron cluster-binding protein [Nitrincola iocasae]|uniref:Nitrogen fixation protein n=1 Tax=Nitrincola iocasae TaxID=2614693 RepID=A0A5J6LG36_9GAMM|nr:NifB/NifX family molybdenum-iron cluster-binding protein [Nitrincola iocasae]QEW07527.1 nitrogen fixation protein [Nitrincola iocasae]
MKIAVTSQNRKTVTGHAGRCRKFWIYTLEESRVVDKSLLELSKDESFHDSDSNAPHPLDNMNILLTAEVGKGLSARLARKGIRVVVTQETDPDSAIKQLVQTTE